MRRAALTLPLLLASCAGTASAPPLAAAPSWLALGSDTGWAVEITPDQIRYSGDYGAVQIAEPNPGAQPAGEGRSIKGSRLSLRIMPGPCSDGTDARRYAERVALIVDGRRLSGCGGAILPPPSLAGSRWNFTHLGGAAIVDTAATELRFAAGQMSASAGCNRFTATYTIAGDLLSPGLLATTRMACSGSAATQETALTALLAAPLTIRFGADGSMTLTGKGGTSARLVARP